MKCFILLKDRTVSCGINDVWDNPSRPRQVAVSGCHPHLKLMNRRPLKNFITRFIMSVQSLKVHKSWTSRVYEERAFTEDITICSSYITTRDSMKIRVKCPLN